MTGTLLGVWAHPDDEAYLSAGLMARARRRGQRVVVVTATAGEQGTDRPDLWPPQRLAALRRHELRASLAALGVSEHLMLGMPDGGLDRIDAAPSIAAIVDTVRPDTIVTFGPDGMTGHRDHRAVSAWTTAAWRATGCRAQLWYAATTTEFHHRWGDVNDRIGVWAEVGPPPAVHPSDVAFSLELDDDQLDQKLAALRAHASQTTGLIEAMGLDDYRIWWRTESFVDSTHSPAVSPASFAGAHR